MTCDRVQAGVSRAIDEDRTLAGFEDHLAVCPECNDFAEWSLEVAARYRRRVLLGIGRLQGAMPLPPVKSSWARWLVPLAAAILVLLSVPLRRPLAASSTPAPLASARVPLFDGVPSDPIDVPMLAWSGECPLPRRLDQDLPGSLTIEFEPSVALPSSLRF